MFEFMHNAVDRISQNSHGEKDKSGTTYNFKK